MKKAIFLFSICVLALAHFSCKKTSNTTGTSSGAGGNGTTSGTTTVTSTSATSYYAIFLSGIGQTIVNGNLQAPDLYLTDAYFSSVPAFYQDASTAVTVDSAFANGIPLMYASWDGMYEDTLGISAGSFQPITYPVTWHIAGKNGIPGFTYQEPTPLPTYTGYAALPDTVDHSHAFSFPLNGLANYTYVSISLDDGQQHGAGQTYGNNVTTASFSISDMNQCLPGNNAMITVVLMNNIAKKVNGKDMNFTTSYRISKRIIMK